jgi:cytochrome b561
MTHFLRYHPVLVALHWVLAALIIAVLVLGALVMVHIPNSEPMKIEALRSHMACGILILLLMPARWLVRGRTAHPAPAATANPLLDRLTWISHRLFYPAVTIMAGSGLAMAVQAGLPAIVFGAQGTLPADFWVYPLRPVHYLMSRVLIGLIALHVAGALYHTFILRDRLLRRMAFGSRTPANTDAGPPNLRLPTSQVHR